MLCLLYKFNMNIFNEQACFSKFNCGDHIIYCPYMGIKSRIYEIGSKAEKVFALSERNTELALKKRKLNRKLSREISSFCSKTWTSIFRISLLLIGNFMILFFITRPVSLKISCLLKNF